MRRQLILASILGLLVAGCDDAPGGAPPSAPTSAGHESVAASDPASEFEASEPEVPSAPATGDFSACLLTDGSEEQASTAPALEGLRDAEAELGVVASVLESASASQHRADLDTLVAGGCDLIVLLGSGFAEATRSAAQEQPEQDFAIVDAAVDPPLENVLGLTFAIDEAAFLAGYLAAGSTDTGKVATFGAVPTPAVTVAMDGFAAGVAHFNLTQGGAVELLGWDPADPDSGMFVGDFEDRQQARTLTEQLLSADADIIMPVAGAASHGAADAVRASGGAARLIWTETDGCVSAEDHCDLILTSVLKNVDAAVYTALDIARSGDFEGGSYNGSLSNGGVGLAPYHEFEGQVPEELTAMLEELEAGIIEGSISVDPTP